MSAKSYRKIDLATSQLEVAIKLFITEKDFVSSITLAGAADVLFCELVSRTGEKNFTDFWMKETNESRKRTEVGREINDTLHINALKHLNPGSPGVFEMNPRESALGAILKALPNYKMVEGHNPRLAQAFLAWVRVNLDPKIYNIHCDPNWGNPDPASVDK